MKKRKFSIKLCMITAGLLLCTQLPVFAATGKSTTSSLRIRKTASTESEVLEVLATGDKVEILGEEGDWYKITAKGYTGYVSKSYINVDKDVANNNNQNNEQNVPSTTTQTNQATQPNETTNNNNENTENNNDGGNSNNNENNTANNEQNNNQQQENNSENTNNNNAQEGDNKQNIAPENKVTTNKVYKIAENTQVYILPVLTSETIGDAAKDTNVSLINNAGLWGYVQTDSVKGWVRIDKLSSEDVPVQSQDNSSNEQNNNQNANEQNNQTGNNEQNNNPDNNAQNNGSENNNSEANNTQNNQQNNNTQTNNEQQNNEQNNNTQVAYQPKTMYIKSTAVNVRSQSNTNSDIITGIGLNTQVKVVGEENGWYKVEVNGKSGFIRKDLLSDSKTETSSRSGDIERTKQTEQKQAQNAQQSQNKQQPQNTTKVTTTTQDNPATTKTSSGVTGNDIVAYAKKFEGYRYVYGAAGPNSFDCSGFTMYVYKHFGYSLSHSSKVQATQGVAVTGNLQAGDILVFKNGSSIGHVGIYIGNDKFIHASDSTTGVIISNLSDKWNISKYVGARRILK